MVEIADNDELYRRIHSACVDDDGGINSAAFKTNNLYDKSISVDLKRLTTVDQSVARGRAGTGLASLEAKRPRALGFSVRHDPNPAEDPRNEAHSLIEGQVTRTTARLLADAATLVVLSAPRPTDRSNG